MNTLLLKVPSHPDGGLLNIHNRHGVDPHPSCYDTLLHRRPVSPEPPRLNLALMDDGEGLGTANATSITHYVSAPRKTLEVVDTSEGGAPPGAGLDQGNGLERKARKERLPTWRLRSRTGRRVPRRTLESPECRLGNMVQPRRHLETSRTSWRGPSCAHLCTPQPQFQDQRALHFWSKTPGGTLERGVVFKRQLRVEYAAEGCVFCGF